MFEMTGDKASKSRAHSTLAAAIEKHHYTLGLRNSSRVFNALLHSSSAGVIAAAYAVDVLERLENGDTSAPVPPAISNPTE